MADSSLLRVRRRVVTSGVTIVSISGEIDLATAGMFRDSLSPHLADPATKLLVCDLTLVRFLGCGGLSVLVDARSVLAARGARLAVVANQPAVLRPVTVTGLGDMLRPQPDLATAIDQSYVE